MELWVHENEEHMKQSMDPLIEFSFWIVGYGVEGKALATWMRLRGVEYGWGKYPQKRVVEVTGPLLTYVALYWNIPTTPSPGLCSSLVGMPHFLSCLVESCASLKALLVDTLLTLLLPSPILPLHCLKTASPISWVLALNFSYGM